MLTAVNTGQLHPDFQRELARLLNRHSLDDACRTPDFILAGMLTEHLEAHRKTMDATVRWHGWPPLGERRTPPAGDRAPGAPVTPVRAEPPAAPA